MNTEYAPVKTKQGAYNERILIANDNLRASWTIRPPTIRMSRYRTIVLPIHSPYATIVPIFPKSPLTMQSLSM